MKKSGFDIRIYIPIVIASITVIGTVIGSAFTILGRNQAIETDIRWIKDELKEIKSQTKNIDMNVSKTNNVIDGFAELISMLENQTSPSVTVEVKKKGKK